jgi:hypothetical protein
VQFCQPGYQEGIDLGRITLIICQTPDKGGGQVILGSGPIIGNLFQRIDCGCPPPFPVPGIDHVVGQHRHGRRSD